MEFMRSGPDIVRSGTQRRLLDYWHGLRGPVPLPASQSIEPHPPPVASDDLSLTDVTPSRDGPRFRIAYHGTRVAELYGRVNCVGKFLGEILPAPASGATLAIYRHVVDVHMPIYTVSDLRDRSGRIVHYERLLLPFGTDSKVERILGCLETVSPEGAFENKGLMSSSPRPPAFALCTTIDY